jgi:putative aldouronate transport system permease protein
MAFLCFIPLWIAFAASVSDEMAIVNNGFSIIPQKTTLDNYRFILNQRGYMLFQALGVTAIVILAGTSYTLMVTTSFAYTVSQKNFRPANPLSFFAWFTMVFSGGVLPWYILVTKYYHLQNNIFALFIPYGMNVFYMFILRNSFKAIPEELTEAAKIEGASHARIFFTIKIPLAKVGLVTIVLFTILQFWNDF